MQANTKPKNFSHFPFAHSKYEHCIATVKNQCLIVSFYSKVNEIIFKRYYNNSPSTAFFSCSKIFKNEQTTKNKSFKDEKIFLIFSRIHDFKSARN